MLAFTMTVPETVPVSSKIGAGNTAVVPFAGIVKVTVLEPFENITAWSSMGTTLVDVNERFSEPDIGFGCGVETDNPTTTC
jgi:hypothetical protein